MANLKKDSAERTPVASNKQIRLLTIRPPEEDDAILDCHVETYDIKSAPAFDYLTNAFSFNPEIIAQVWLCNEIYFIPRSLEILLRHLIKAVRRGHLLFAGPLCVTIGETPGAIRASCELAASLASRCIDLVTFAYSLEDKELAALKAASPKAPGYFKLPDFLRQARFSQSSDEEADGLAHQPLDFIADEVRLLILCPRSDDRAIGELTTVNCLLSNERLPFTALSYAWGDAQDQSSIAINNQTCRIQRNLYDFLVEIQQYVDRQGSADLFWIDALCIDQNNAAEKSREIRRMNRIYSAAQLVIAWLGQDEDGSNDVLASFRRSKEQQSYLVTTADNIRQAPEYYKAHAKLFMRPYFARAWCSQELAFAQRIVLMAGHATAGWDAFAAMSTYYTDWRAYLTLILEMLKDDKSLRQRYFSFYMGVSYARFAFVERVRERQKAGKKCTLLSLLLGTIHLESQLPKDKIYSLWAMADDAAQLLPEPNYDQSDEKVFTDFTKAWIMRYGSLDILSTVCWSSRRSISTATLPTWVPNWTGPNIRRPLISNYPGILRNDQLDEVEYHKTYNASAGMCAMLGFDEQGSRTELLSNGLSCDVIRYLGTRHTGNTVSHEDWWDSVPKEAQEEFGFALIGGKDPTGSRLREQGPNPVIFGPDSTDPNTYLGQLMYRKHVHYIISGRRLAITHKGHVGLVPNEAEEGDEVAIIFGCQTPLILRILPSGHRAVIGDAYFHRMMDGQMVAEVGGPDACYEHALPGFKLRPKHLDGRFESFELSQAGINKPLPSHEGSTHDDDAYKLPSGKPLGEGRYHSTTLPEAMRSLNFEEHYSHPPTAMSPTRHQMFLLL